MLHKDSCGCETLEFIEKIERLSGADEVMDFAQRTFAQQGFVSLLVGGLPHPDQRLDEAMLAMRFPAELMKIYCEKDVVSFCPVLRRMKQSRLPFEWNEVRKESADDLRVAELWQLRDDFALRNGFIVPIHKRSGKIAFVSLGHDSRKWDTSKKLSIHLEALYLFDRINRIRGVERGSNAALTKREREVLTWIALGKTAWEIGEILRIAKRTVDEHAQTAFRKLDTVNRTQAVAIALRDRLISI